MAELRAEALLFFFSNKVFFSLTGGCGSRSRSTTGAGCRRESYEEKEKMGVFCSFLASSSSFACSTFRFQLWKQTRQHHWSHCAPFSHVWRLSFAEKTCDHTLGICTSALRCVWADAVAASTCAQKSCHKSHMSESRSGCWAPVLARQ